MNSKLRHLNFMLIATICITGVVSYCDNGGWAHSKESLKKVKEEKLNLSECNLGQFVREITNLHKGT